MGKMPKVPPRPESACEAREEPKGEVARLRNKVTPVTAVGSKPVFGRNLYDMSASKLQ